VLVLSQSHVTADGQSASQSWCRAPSGTHDQIFSPTSWLLWSLFFLGRPLWWEGGSVICRSLCRVRIFTLLLIVTVYIVQYVQGLCQSRLCEADYYALFYFLGPPSLLSIGYRGPFPGVQRGRLVTLTTHCIECRGQEWVGAIPLPLGACMV
jgi:hypothetical protein